MVESDCCWLPASNYQEDIRKTITSIVLVENVVLAAPNKKPLSPTQGGDRGEAKDKISL